ncbi:MAG TPA: protein kinase [Kofleriaceae bacterium]|nr:protein kinase [Kofleriaceae bacterium]
MVSEELARAQRLVGRILDDKFRLRACIGIGGSGVVYKADQIALGRTVAVKILSEELTSDPRLVKRFHDEALAASRLNHPNTVSIIDYGQTPDGLLYIVMEYLRGPTLTHLLSREHPLPAARVLGIVSQILAGIEEAHLAGVVHADLKCDNIVVETRRTGQDTVKVVDFGIARLVNAPRDGEDRNICGTPEYMAPEIISGAPPSFASDLYAVGIVMYELLAGQTPFVGGSAVDILTRQLKSEPPALGLSVRNLPSGLQPLIARALAKKPQERFVDAAEMRDAVDELVTHALTTVKIAAVADEVVCPSCGDKSPARFRFCPECGHPRAPRASSELPVVQVPGPLVEAHEITSPFPLPLVGRDAALDAVCDFLSGKTSAPALLLVGDSGSGRSSLLREAYVRVADAAGVTIFQSDADPSGVGATLYPMRALISTILELPPVCARADLDAAAGARGISQRDVPGLAELFGHPSELSELDPPIRRREVIAATSRALAAEAERGATAVVFEDAERYDQPTLELLRRMVERRIGDARIIVVLDEEHARTWPADCIRVRLEPLDSDDLAFIIAQMQRAAQAGLPTVLQLTEITGGSPAHVEHLLHYLAEGGSVEQAPSSLADLVAARLAFLPRDTLVAVQAVAVFGTEAPPDAVGRISALGDASDKALEVAVRAGLVARTPEVVRFTSALIRDVVYDATPASVRRQLHLGAIDELVAQGAPAAVLGTHHEAAGNRANAVVHLASAGDLAARQLDEQGAAHLFQRALLAARHALTGGDLQPAELVTISIKLAETLRITGELALARGVLHEAELWGEQGPRLTALLLRASGQLAAAESEPSAAIPHLQRSVGAAIATGDGELIAETYLDLAAVLIRVSKSQNARRELEEAIDMVTLGEGGASPRAPRNLWRLTLKLAQLAVTDQELPRAVELGEMTLAQAQRVSARAGAARVQSLLASCHERLGNHLLAERHRRSAVDELRKMGDRRGTAELLLYGTGPGRTLMRISPEVLREARELASEVGWTEGEERARSAVNDAR